MGGGGFHGYLYAVQLSLSHVHCDHFDLEFIDSCSL